MVTVAAFLTIAIGMAHSYLGERYILIRLFRRDNLPKLFGSDRFIKQTLRLAWHLTTVAWFGYGAVLLHLSVAEKPSSNTMFLIVAVVFFLSGLLSLVASRGKHLSWLVFWSIAAIAFYSASISY